VSHSSQCVKSALLMEYIFHLHLNNDNVYIPEDLCATKAVNYNPAQVSLQHEHFAVDLEACCFTN
jgi:hypothetical protein